MWIFHINGIRVKEEHGRGKRLEPFVLCGICCAACVSGLRFLFEQSICSSKRKASDIEERYFAFVFFARVVRIVLYSEKEYKDASVFVFCRAENHAFAHARFDRFCAVA